MRSFVHISCAVETLGARAVASNPDVDRRNYQLRTLAWASLMSARGKRVNMTRLNADARDRRKLDRRIHVVS
ncbi:hypothetical protein AAD018_011410 [Aestuariibius insulae]|uniref:hypothetical protein n=1 Tax=Aestuariibius insulae TaxID=2058287 RepID=UPI00345EE1FC